MGRVNLTLKPSQVRTCLRAGFGPIDGYISPEVTYITSDRR